MRQRHGVYSITEQACADEVHDTSARLNRDKILPDLSSFAITRSYVLMNISESVNSSTSTFLCACAILLYALYTHVVMMLRY